MSLLKMADSTYLNLLWVLAVILLRARDKQVIYQTEASYLANLWIFQSVRIDAKHVIVQSLFSWHTCCQGHTWVIWGGLSTGNSKLLWKVQGKCFIGAVLTRRGVQWAEQTACEIAVEKEPSEESEGQCQGSTCCEVRPYKPLCKFDSYCYMLLNFTCWEVW